MPLMHLRKSLLYCMAIAGLSFVSGVASAADNDLDWLGQPETRVDSIYSVIVFLDSEPLQADVRRASTRPDMTRDERIRLVRNRLTSYRPTNAAAVRQFVKKHSLSPVTPLWIVPALTASLTETDIRALAEMSGVSRIVPDREVEFIEPVEVKSASPEAASSSTHQAMLNVPYLWDLGITGEGRLVCSFDTGVEKDHPALSGNWRGNHAPLSASWFSTIAPNVTPYDKNNHGTHTMGTMCGVDGADTIGVAPGAEWITAGVIDQGKSLTATFSDILAAYQWALDPDGDTATTDDVPDVILNSWGVPASLFSPCDETFFAAIDNVEAAGIVCIFSAGNEGPDPRTLRNPGSRASTPLNSFAVGAVDNSKVIAGFSSRGPGGCGFTEIKPEIVAPGINIRSASSDGGYKLMSGTSMAAPFIAGMVALCRQYNPNSTVEEIKWALINSAEDLGAQGEDNAYGYGLPDGSTILSYLSDPETPRFHLTAFAVDGDGIAMPGETFDLRVTLNRTSGSLERVIGRLAVEAGFDAAIQIDSADFYFGISGTTALATQAYQVQFGDNLTNGDSLTLDLEVSDYDGRVYDTLELRIPVGLASPGAVASVPSGRLQFTVSDFAQYGLAPGSIYNLGGDGFRYDGGDNMLYEAGIILGRNSLQLSTSVRGGDGAFKPSDFTPIEPLSEIWSDDGLVMHRHAVMDDALSDVSIPVEVAQTVSYHSDEEVIILRYRLINTSLSTLRDLSFGFFTDFDFTGTSETTTLDLDQMLLTQQSDGSPLVGLVGLAGLSRVRMVSNGISKAALTTTDLFDLIASPSDPNGLTDTDLFTVISGGPYTLGPGDSVEVALALTAGADRATIEHLAARARELYQIPTSVDDDPHAGLPNDFDLQQNYPNPFNPTTTIEFDLPVAADVSLAVFNLLGQKVRQLHAGPVSSGRHAMTWDATSDDGTPVASGVYFYRLSTGETARSRKMILLR